MSNPFFDKPILNSPYERPARHWELDESELSTAKRTTATTGSQPPRTTSSTIRSTCSMTTATGWKLTLPTKYRASSKKCSKWPERYNQHAFPSSSIAFSAYKCNSTDQNCRFAKRRYYPPGPKARSPRSQTCCCSRPKAAPPGVPLDDVQSNA